ncbi:hypothetical protein [Nonomuraea sp. NPDC046570]|uniref:hypothetical protein n=1 Tax=Nonomuraea sp. NPDC046570 TaxID=3155255 RepID=UPI0033D1A3BC
MTSMPGQAGTPMSREGADYALHARKEERDRISGNLLDLESHTSYQLLKGSVLRGVTQRRWSAAMASMAAVWSLYDAYRGTLRAAEEVRARRTRPGPAELTELTELLAGPAVRLAAPALPVEQRSLRANPDETITLDEAVSRMDAAFQEVGDTLTEIDAAWNALLPRLEEAESALRAVDGLQRALEEPPEPGRAAAELARLREAVVADPLDPGQAGADLDRIGALLAARQTDLERAVALKQAYAERVDGLRLAIERLAAAEHDTRAAHGTVVAKIALPESARPAATAEGLAARLAETAGTWQQRARRLDDLDRTVTETERRARLTAQALLGLLGRRDELRGLLLACQAKAVRLGLAERPAAAGLYERARLLLWSAPCDLNRAAAAVTAYQDAIHGEDP